MSQEQLYLTLSQLCDKPVLFVITVLSFLKWLQHLKCFSSRKKSVIYRTNFLIRPITLTF